MIPSTNVWVWGGRASISSAVNGGFHCDMANHGSWRSELSPRHSYALFTYRRSSVHYPPNRTYRAAGRIFGNLAETRPNVKVNLLFAARERLPHHLVRSTLPARSFLIEIVYLIHTSIVHRILDAQA